MLKFSLASVLETKKLQGDWWCKAKIAVINRNTGEYHFHHETLLEDDLPERLDPKELEGMVQVSGDIARNWGFMSLV